MYKQLNLNPDEQKFLGMSVVGTYEMLKETINNQKINWTPEIRKTIKEMIASGEKLKLKLERLGFDMRPMPDLEDGEELGYITKPS